MRQKTGYILFRRLSRVEPSRVQTNEISCRGSQKAQWTRITFLFFYCIDATELFLLLLYFSGAQGPFEKSNAVLLYNLISRSHVLRIDIKWVIYCNSAILQMLMRKSTSNSVSNYVPIKFKNLMPIRTGIRLLNIVA